MEDKKKLECLDYVLANVDKLSFHFPGRNILEIAKEIYIWYIDPELEEKLKKALEIVDKGNKAKLYAEALRNTAALGTFATGNEKL